MGCGSSKDTSSSAAENEPKRTTNDNKPKPEGNTESVTTSNKPKPEGNTGSVTTSNKPKPEGNTGSVTTNNQFVDEAVQSHNKYRAMHGAPPMQAAQELIDYAQKYANEIAKKDTLEHSKCKLPSGGSIGENLYCYWSSDKSAAPTAEMAVQSWYDEIKDYNFDNAGFDMQTGHFTQVVWKESVELGMAWAKAAGGTTYVVANYRPAGNMMGDFEQNVLPNK